MSIRTSLALAALVIGTAPLAAQGRGHAGDKVPRGHLPPPGLCRIWVDGVPPGRQPEPTDCVTARRYAPRNARVIYGERVTAYRDDDRRIRRDDGRYDDGRYDDRKRDDRKRDDGAADDRKRGDTRIFDTDGDEKRRSTDDRKGHDAERSTDRKSSDVKYRTRKL